VQDGREVIVKNGDGRQTWSSNSDWETQQLEKLYGHRSGGHKGLGSRRRDLEWERRTRSRRRGKLPRLYPDALIRDKDGGHHGTVRRREGGLPSHHKNILDVERWVSRQIYPVCSSPLHSPQSTPHTGLGWVRSSWRRPPASLLVTPHACPPTHTRVLRTHVPTYPRTAPWPPPRLGLGTTLGATVVCQCAGSTHASGNDVHWERGVQPGQ
jgi:hypothetical protein